MICDDAHQQLCFRMGIPYPNDTRVAANKQVAAVLLPSRHNSRPTSQTHNLVEPTERADHLHGVCAHGWIIIAIQSDNSVGWEELETSLARSRNRLTCCREYDTANVLVDEMERGDTCTSWIPIIEL